MPQKKTTGKIGACMNSYISYFVRLILFQSLQCHGTFDDRRVLRHTWFQLFCGQREREKKTYWESIATWTSSRSFCGRYCHGNSWKMFSSVNGRKCSSRMHSWNCCIWRHSLLTMDLRSVIRENVWIHDDKWILKSSIDFIFLFVPSNGSKKAYQT